MQQLWYQPHSWDVWHMITAAFAPVSWGHVTGNLSFFLAFAATVEVILGPTLFGAVILALARAGSQGSAGASTLLHFDAGARYRAYRTVTREGRGLRCGMPCKPRAAASQQSRCTAWVG